MRVIASSPQLGAESLQPRLHPRNPPHLLLPPPRPPSYHAAENNKACSERASERATVPHRQEGCRCEMWLKLRRGGGAPPLGKHDRQEKRHKIASSLSQNSDAGDDGIETTTADARIDANNMSMPCRDGGRSSRTPTEGRYVTKTNALPCRGY